MHDRKFRGERRSRITGCSVYNQCIEIVEIPTAVYCRYIIPLALWFVRFTFLANDYRVDRDGPISTDNNDCDEITIPQAILA